MEFSEKQLKTIKVIESCETLEQLETSEKYIELFYYQTNDLEFLRYLIEKRNKKFEEISK
jgi:hypothetical protein